MFPHLRMVNRARDGNAVTQHVTDFDLTFMRQAIAPLNKIFEGSGVGKHRQADKGIFGHSQQSADGICGRRFDD